MLNLTLLTYVLAQKQNSNSSSDSRWLHLWSTGRLCEQFYSVFKCMFFCVFSLFRQLTHLRADDNLMHPLVASVKTTTQDQRWCSFFCIPFLDYSQHVRYLRPSVSTSRNAFFTGLISPAFLLKPLKLFLNTLQALHTWIRYQMSAVRWFQVNTGLLHLLLGSAHHHTIYLLSSYCSVIGRVKMRTRHIKQLTSYLPFKDALTPQTSITS